VKRITRYTLQMVKESSILYDIGDSIQTPQKAADLVNRLFNLKDLAEEQFVMLTLDRKCNCTGAFVVSQGTLDTAVVHPREVFKRALLQNACSILVAHNHPSGDLTPSTLDVDVSKKLKMSGEVLGVELIDHIIVGGDRFLSMKELGLIGG